MAYDIGPMDEGGAGRGARRLLALADYLETIPDRSYDHRVWRRDGPGGERVMCALGHAVTALPDLIGLRWRSPESGDVVRMDGSGVTQDEIVLAAEAFDLTLDDARKVFGVGLYTVDFYGPAGAFGLTPVAAAAAIRSFAHEKLSLALGLSLTAA